MNVLSNSRGVSLVEILIALLVFGIGISLAMRTLPASGSTSKRSRDLSEATNLAQEKIEELMAVEYDGPDLSDGFHTDIHNPINARFTREWTVVDDRPVVGMKQVTVAVSFPSKSSDNSAKLTSIISNSRR